MLLYSNLDTLESKACYIGSDSPTGAMCTARVLGVCRIFGAGQARLVRVMIVVKAKRYVLLEVSWCVE